MKPSLLQTALSLAAFAALGTATTHATSVLLIDDSRGLSVQGAWTTSLSNLGLSYSVETISPSGNASTDLSLFDTVIWTVGDQAYQNLTSANWATMTSYVSGGGSLIYAGGHSVYEENNVGHAAIESFFGVSNTRYNMPSIPASTTASGTGNSATFGTTTYGINHWSGGYYNGTMMSGFNTSTGIGLVGLPVGSGGGPFIVATNAVGNAQLWGLDLNQVASADRDAFLGASLGLLPSSAVPDASTTMTLLAGSFLGLAFLRRRET